MYLDCTCVEIGPKKWDLLMKGARKCAQKIAVKAALEVGVIDEYTAKMEMRYRSYNPYIHYRTKKHIIYVHSSIEHFIKF
jgi:hypothetical protein